MILISQRQGQRILKYELLLVFIYTYRICACDIECRYGVEDYWRDESGRYGSKVLRLVRYNNKTDNYVIE